MGVPASVSIVNPLLQNLEDSPFFWKKYSRYPGTSVSLETFIFLLYGIGKRLQIPFLNFVRIRATQATEQ